MESDLLREGDRIMTICNACRYCEGYCAVFPAMEQRTSFGQADLNYLANLCHNCSECLYACQYAPPHEFAVNVPQTLAQIRAASYRQYTWPRAFGFAFRKGGMVALILTLLLAGPALVFSPHASGPGFYSVIPHSTMVTVFGIAGVWAALVWAIGFGRFWSEIPASPGAKEFASALRDIFRLEYLSSGGAGCTYPNEHHSQARRVFHHFTFYGFLLCFASTTVAAFYDYVLRREAPYPVLSLPVLLGIVGGIGLLVGPVGLIALKRRRDPDIADLRQDGLDYAFLFLLLASAATGLALLMLRGSSAMGTLLAVHLGVVLALFLTLPYGKFVHGIYRGAALLRYAVEKARP